MRGRSLETAALVMLAGICHAADQDVSFATATSDLGNGKMQWTVFVKGTAEALTRIKCVQYKLDPTFPHPLRVVCERGAGERAFSLTDTSWGPLTLSATIISDHETNPVDITVKIPESRSGVVLNLHAIYVKHDGFPRSTKWRFDLLLNGSIVSSIPQHEFMKEDREIPVQPGGELTFNPVPLTPKGPWHITVLAYRFGHPKPVRGEADLTLVNGRADDFKIEVVDKPSLGVFGSFVFKFHAK